MEQKWHFTFKKKMWKLYITLQHKITWRIEFAHFVDVNIFLIKYIFVYI